MSDLANRWDAMTAREKDAEVAKAKGVQVCNAVTGAAAGQLLEELATMAEGGLLLTSSGSTGPWLLHIDGPDGVLVSEEGPTIPDVVALAYCLAKGAAPSISKP